MKEQLKIDFEKILKISNFSEKDIKFKKDQLDKFIENIKQLPTNPQERADKIKAMMKDIDSNALFYSGTSIRKTNKLLFAASPYINPNAVDGSLSGLDKLGLIGGDIEWNINSSDPKEKHIALIMLETMSPRPSLSNVETLMSPMAIELANFTGTAIELGKEKYTKLVKFYEQVNKSDNPSSTMRSLLRDSKTKAAVKDFTELADKIRTNMKDGLPAIIELEEGIEMAYGAHITSGSYGKCGNTSMLMREAFAIVKENKVVYTSKYVHTDTEVSHYNFDIPIGVMFKMDGKTPTDTPDPEPTPEPEAVPEAETYTSGGAGPRNLNEGGLTNSDNSAQQGLE